MATRILALEVTGDAADAADALDSVGAAAGRMADKVDTASRSAGDSVSRFDAVGESADEMASRSSQAAGGLGDLGGALGLLPGPLGSVGRGMEAVAPAIMGVTGASDLLNLVTKSSIVTQTRARAAAIATGIANKAQAAATLVTAAAQRVLNAAMRANPVGLVITAIVALIAVIVLAYKRSERFRAIVQGAMRVAKVAVTAVIRVVAQLVGWIVGKAVAAWRKLQGAAVAVGRAIGAAIGRVVDVVGRLIGWVRDRLVAGFQRWRSIVSSVVGGVVGAFGRVIDKVGAVIGWVRDRLGAAIRKIPTGPIDAVKSAFGWVADKVQWVIDKVQSLIGWIGKIDFPKIPDLNPFNRSVIPGGLLRGGDVASGGVTIHLTVNGAIDPVGTARTIRETLARADRILGS